MPGPCSCIRRLTFAVPRRGQKLQLMSTVARWAETSPRSMEPLDGTRKNLMAATQPCVQHNKQRHVPRSAHSINAVLQHYHLTRDLHLGVDRSRTSRPTGDGEF